MLKAVEQKQERENEQGFVIDNDKKASWALRKIKHMKDKQEENEELAQSQIDEIQKEIEEVRAWLDQENGKLDNNIEFMENKLKGYALKLKRDDPELKTHSLPFGALKFRKQRPKWKYDEDKLLNFVEASMRNALQIKKKVNKRKLKKEAEVVDSKAVSKNTGEIIKGVTIVNRPEKFKVDVQ